MINLKALTLTTLLVLGSASPALALSYPGDRGGNTPTPTIDNVANPGGVRYDGYCHTAQEASDYWLKKDGFDCHVSSRTNANGHKVWDITDRHGWKTTVVLWQNGKADVIQSNGTWTATWTRGNDDRIEIYSDDTDYSMAFPTN